jgi:ABC-type branched-subunit amino acid transport system permease subunit
MRQALLARKKRPLWIGAAALIALPFAMPVLGLTVNTASVVVTLAIAAMGLNILVGFTGLTSFGHAAWFGLGAYSAGLVQKHFLPDQILLPILASLALTALVSTATGFLILRRRGVYFALLTLALVALCYSIAFRWTAVTGGEDGLGGLARGRLGPIDLDHAVVYYAFIAIVAFAVLYCLLRVVRSPFGHVLVAIRENQLRATFQGYAVDRYRLAAFVLSATVTGLAGALTAFLHYLVSADATSVVFSGELLAMVVIGGMHHILGPALGALFYILLRELLSIWTGNWLLWFGLIFIGFVLYSPGGLVGVWSRLMSRCQPKDVEAAAMSKRRIYEGLELPQFLQPKPYEGLVLEARGVAKHFGGIRAVNSADLVVESGMIHALIGPNGAGKTTLFNVVSGIYPPDKGSVRLRGREIAGLPPDRICAHGLARSFQITSLFRSLSIYENIRLSLQGARPAAARR